MSGIYEWIDKAQGKYILIRQYQGNGAGHIAWGISAFKNGGYVVLFLLFLGYTADDFPKWFITALAFGYLVLTTFLGWGWDKLKGWQKEAEFANKRNLLACEIREKLK